MSNTRSFRKYSKSLTVHAVYDIIIFIIIYRNQYRGFVYYYYVYNCGTLDEIIYKYIIRK